MVPGTKGGSRNRPVVLSSKHIAILALHPACSLISIVTTAIRSRTIVVLAAFFLFALPLLNAVLLGTDHGSDSKSDERLVRTLANSAPSFAQNLPLYIYATTDVAFDMAIKVADADNDTVNVTWEWGDNSPNGLNSTDPALAPVWVNQTHTWSVPREPGMGDYYAGPFLVNITLDDGMGGTRATQRYAYVYVPPNGVPEMSLSAPDRIDPSDSALIVANASDPEGDPLTWTLVLNNSVSDFLTVVLHTPATAPNETVWNNYSYVFGVEGDYAIKMNVSDALPPNQLWPHNISYSVSVLVETNKAPEVLGVIETDPESLIINASIGYLVVNYSIEANDPDGDVLYVFWDFGDGSPSQTNISTGGTVIHEFVQQRNYSDPCERNISVTVGDGRPGHNVSLSRLVEITSTNLPPGVVSLAFNYSQNRSYALPNETVLFELVIGDPESDTIGVVVSFGDNTTLEYYELSEFVGANTSLILNHSFASPGEFIITIWYTDNKTGLFDHSKHYNVTVTVKEPPPPVNKDWTTWDYISLSLFLCAFVIPIAWAILGLRHREDW